MSHRNVHRTNIRRGPANVRFVTPPHEMKRALLHERIAYFRGAGMDANAKLLEDALARL